MTQHILIGDSSKYFDQTIWQSLLPHLEFNIIGIADDSQTITRLALAQQPDTILIDLSASEMGGLWMVQSLRAIRPEATIITLLTGASPQYSQAAKVAGATACLVKSDVAETLPETLRTLQFSPNPSEFIY